MGTHYKNIFKAHGGGIIGSILPLVPWLFKKFTGKTAASNSSFFNYALYRYIFSRKGSASENIALGVLLAAGVKTGQMLYERPGFHATIDSAVRAFFTGTAECEVASEEVDRAVSVIVELFKREEVTLGLIAIDGVPGSGKTTLATKLANKLGLAIQTLDHWDMGKQIYFSNNTVYEHHRLLRTQDIDIFDVLIYIDEPVHISKSKILKRQRGGYLVEIMDFDKMKRVGDKAFAVAAGRVHEIPGSYLKVKIKPPGGSYMAHERLTQEIRKKGIDPIGLTKEELLLLITDHKVQKGFTAYIRAGDSAKKLLSKISLHHI